MSWRQSISSSRQYVLLAALSALAMMCGETTELVIKLDFVCNVFLSTLLTRSVSPSQVQNAFDPPILLAKVASLQCPGARLLQLLES